MSLYHHIEAQFPPIGGGVVNGALVLSESEFTHTTVDIIRQNTDAKLQGTLLLDELSGPNADLGFFIVFGSMISISGNYGRGSIRELTAEAVAALPSALIPNVVVEENGTMLDGKM
ncbi:hypothetical protein BJX61DRAFT_546257 [Aspergillus egyptiacus]|nr:hypothetical protein BJX61DRAFT_546257 [Aspergillus egyptiacus]